ncbi:MAG: hypothetical protein AAFX09_01745 [Pseudomonadota bacterium]
MELAETLNRRARMFAVLQALGFFAWQAGDGLARSDTSPAGFVGPAFMASGIGLGVWVVSLIVFFGVSWHAKKAGVFDIMNDEWSRHVRMKAAEAAFWATAIGVVVSMTATNFGVDGWLLLKVLTGLAVASFLLAYAWYDSRHEDGAHE